MSVSQKIVSFILPNAWFDRIRESSEKWMIQCPKCQSERSVWSTGGIRFGAASCGKRIAAQCKNCGLVPAKIYFRDRSAVLPPLK